MARGDPHAARMSYNHLRKGRVSIAGQVYLVTAVTHSRRRVFDDFTSARLLVGELRRLEEEGAALTLAFVVMPDHLHWLMTLTGSLTLADCVQRLKGRSARQIKSHARLRGKVWQAAYHDHALRREEDIKDVARYIVTNPRRAGLVARTGLYPHWDAVWV